MTFWLLIKKINLQYFTCIVLVTLLLLNSGCTTNNKKIAGGMLAGSVVGALVGYQFVHHGENKQYEEENTVITSVLFALITGGVLAWHYRGLEDLKVEISGRYARYRLCDPEELKTELSEQLEYNKETDGTILQMKLGQIGKYAISLDDNTKWAFPSFRKRYLQPELGETQVVSKRYIWEIIKPGSFVTRSQNPSYFYEAEEE